jgi:hypothetical protein
MRAIKRLVRGAGLLALAGCAAATVHVSPSLPAPSPVGETLLLDEAGQGDLDWAKPDAKPAFEISRPGVHVLRGTGIDGLDDADAFVFEVTGEKPFDIAVVSDAAEFKKLRSIAADGKVAEIALGSTNPTFRAPRDIVRDGPPPGRYHVELLFGPQGAVGEWFVKIAPRDGAAPGEPLHKPGPEPTTADKMKNVNWPGAISIYHGHNWGKDEKYPVAVKEAGYRATGVAEYQIDQVARLGLRAFVFIWPHESPTIPPKYRDDKTVLCYYLSDRIRPAKWASWASLEKMCYKGDPHHPAVFTIRSLWGGIDAFCPVVRGRIMEYYHYHWDSDRSPHMHFALLDQYRRASIANGDVPVCRIVEVRPEEMRRTRQTVYTCLAYGVRGYRMGGTIFDTSKRDERGVPTRNAYGEEILRLNTAINAYSPTFKTTRCNAVYHVAPLPTGCAAVPSSAWFKLEGKEVLVGVFGDRSEAKPGNSADYLLVANRDAFHPRTATLKIAGAHVRVQRMDKPSAQWRDHPARTEGAATIVQVELGDGSGELLKIDNRPR